MYKYIYGIYNNYNKIYITFKQFEWHSNSSDILSVLGGTNIDNGVESALFKYYKYFKMNWLRI